LNAKDDDQLTLEERTVDKTCSMDKEIEYMSLREAIDTLSGREQIVIDLRYLKDYTQQEVGKRLGISQVQVSRIERCAIDKLKAASQ
jgi:RNA polymerase sporulation-specific sigma factor